MKKSLLLAFFGLLILFIGCAREQNYDPDIKFNSREVGDRLVTVKTEFSVIDEGDNESKSESDTKSSIDIDNAETFNKAVIFVMDDNSSDGEILLVNGKGLFKEMTSKSDELRLPLNTACYLYVIENYGDLDISGYIERAEDGDLRVANLNNITYTCTSTNDFLKLDNDGYGIPMAGIVPISASQITSHNSTVNIRVKKLYSKWNISFDDSEAKAAGYTPSGVYIFAMKSNTRCPFFVEGSKATSASNVKDKIDQTSVDDLISLNEFSPSNKISLYFLENCQGDHSGATKWYDVAKQTPGLDYASYISFAFQYIKDDTNEVTTCCYYLYLGGDCVTNFDVRRNYVTNLNIKVPVPGPQVDEGFFFTNTNAISVAPGEYVDVPYETHFTLAQVNFTSIPSGLTFTKMSHTAKTSSTPISKNQYSKLGYYGVVRITADSSANEGTYEVTGGGETLKDIMTVYVNEKISLTATAPTRRVQFERFQVNMTIPKATLVKILSKIAPGPSWSSGTVAFTTGAQNLIKNNLSIRNSSGYEATDFEGVKLIQVSAVPQPVSNPTALRVSFTLLNTEMGGTRKIDIYNKADENVYVRDLDVSARQLTLTRIQTASSGYPNNGFWEEEDQYGLGASVYKVSIDGGNRTVYLRPTAYVSGSTVDANILASDIGDYEFLIRHDSSSTSYWGDRFDINGINNNSSNDEKVQLVTNSSGTVDYFKWNYALCTYDVIEDYTEYEWACAETVFDSYIKYDGHEECLEGDMLLLRLMNPRAEWYGISYDEQDEQQAWDHIDCWFTTVLDGSSEYTNVYFGQDHMVEFPYESWSDYCPYVLSSAHVTTSKGSSQPYQLICGEHGNWDVESFKIANDLHNYGQITIGYEFENENSGECLEFIWAKINVIREFTIYCGYQYAQYNYLTNSSTPYSNGNLSRFIPYLYAPNLDNILGTGTLTKIIRTTATNTTGINAVNPSENFFRTTNNSEKWYCGYENSRHTLWGCESGSSDRECLLQNKIVVYNTPQLVTNSGKEYSWYELQYAGPIVSNHLGIIGLGHSGHHADFIYSHETVALWNEPKFEFKSGVTINGLGTTSVVSDKLEIGDRYTRVAFFWKKNKYTGSKINTYDTRYQINRSYTNYLTWFGTGSTMKTSNLGTAYYDPRRITGYNYFKLYAADTPFYRAQRSDYQDETASNKYVESASGESTGVKLGYYTPEYSNGASHIFGRAYGLSDSYWLPGNLIQ